MTGYVFAKILKYMEGQQGAGASKYGTPVTTDTELGKQCLNLVMMSHFDNACYSLDPAVKDSGAQARQAHQREVIKVKFLDSINFQETSVEAISHLFRHLGDFAIYKDTKQSVLLDFIDIKPKIVQGGNVQGVINYILNRRHDLMVETCMRYDQTEKFVGK